MGTCVRVRVRVKVRMRVRNGYMGESEDNGDTHTHTHIHTRTYFSPAAVSHTPLPLACCQARCAVAVVAAGDEDVTGAPHCAQPGLA